MKKKLNKIVKDTNNFLYKYIFQSQKKTELNGSNEIWTCYQEEKK